jgi:hypothetical protein
MTDYEQALTGIIAHLEIMLQDCEIDAEYTKDLTVWELSVKLDVYKHALSMYLGE